MAIAAAMCKAIGMAIAIAAAASMAGGMLPIVATVCYCDLLPYIVNI